MSMRTKPRRGGLLAALAVTGVLAGCAGPRSHRPVTQPTPRVAAPTTVTATTVPLPVPAGLTDPGLSLRAPPVAVPLELELPSVKVQGPVLAVGITATNVMDAPEGPAKDPVWQDAFWYRGGAVPGAVGTATIAGHIDDSLGRLAIFGHLQDLRPGDPIVIHDGRTGLDERFMVTASASYTLAQAAQPLVLDQIYGAGPVQGRRPEPSADGLAHLTLITCAGTFDYSKGTHDHRLVVYAVRVS